jgi:hypothetical protein
MNYRHFKHEGWLYALAFLFAILLRFAQLDAMPLTDAEAAPALQALQITQGLKPALDPHPFYILSTAVLFFTYSGGTDFLARLIPALAGSVLVLVPLLFAERIKPRAAVFLAFFLALDPGLVALSRQIASPILALTFTLLTLGFYNRQKPTLAAIFAALAFLGGPSIWSGVLGLAITLGIWHFLNSRRPQTSSMETESSSPDSQPLTASVQPSTFDPTTRSGQRLRTAILPFLAAFLLAGSLFFIVPNGLSAALASIPAFIKSWLGVSYISVGRLFFSLLVYQPLGVLLAVFALIRGWKNGSSRIIPLSIWFLVALLLVIFNPSRQLADLAWTLIPLWAMAALELIRNVDVFIEERAEVAGVVFLTVFIWTFAWLDFSGLNTFPTDSREYLLRIWLLVGSLFLLVMSLLLVAAGWSIRIARIGGIWGIVLALGTFGVGGAVGTAGLRGGNFPELWWLPEQPIHARLLESTVSDVSEWGIGDDHAAAVTIVGIDSPALEWVLRERRVSIAQSLDSASAPAIVITPLQDDPILSSAYRGQDFAWRQTPLWNISVPSDWLRWTALRQMPPSGETIILWVRDDLFINSVATGNP